MTALAIGDILANRQPPKRQRTFQPVWRNSYYEGQLEHRIWRPFADGSKRGGARLAGALLKSAREMERRTRVERRKETPGMRNGVLGQVGIDVLEFLLSKVDYMTGRLDPAIATIAEATGYCYSAVHDALRRLRSHGFIDWIRRSRPLDKEGEAGPQVEQITNAYMVLIPEALSALRKLFERAPVPEDEQWRREDQKRHVDAMLASVSAREFLAVTWDGDPLAGATLRRIAARLDGVEEAERGSPRAVETRGSNDP